MYRFHDTQDAELIRKVCCHPSVYKFLHDDYVVPAEQWNPTFHDCIKYFLVRDEKNELLGLFICGIHSAIEVEIHTAFLPRAWGRHVRAAAIEFREWIWKHSDIQRIIGKVATCNKASMRYAEAIGMKQFGLDEKSMMWGGELRDQAYFGISRPGV
jgi:RimJ/RimL family protein N-acetyltransferase